jgi:hypothetical protein
VSDRDAVDLTANEVRNAMGWLATDLFVVDGIELHETPGSIETRVVEFASGSTGRPARNRFNP